MKNLIFALALLIFSGQFFAQILPDKCKLDIGTNLSGISDYSAEIPFVDLMKVCRTWYSKDVNNPNGSPFDSGTADSLSYRSDGYPSHVPQVVPGRSYTQKVSTIWAIADGWKPGNYVVLFDGVGQLSFWGGLSNLTVINANKYTFSFNTPIGSILEMTIESSLASDPVRNIRIVHADYESTYLTQQFNPVWLEKLLAFKSVRFMDWGHTNNWGQKDPWSWDDSTLFNWSDRSTMDYYTWTHNRGIPYEMMIKLMNDYDLAGWVCVPHRASNDYIDNMARLFKQSLEPNLELTVEYSNEIWNWLFGQANWAFKYGCTLQGVSWPEGIVPYVQNCLDRWTMVYGTDVNRIKRAVGLQTGWLDVSQRMTYNMKVNSFDVIAPAYYFGLDDVDDAQLDALGASATVSDIDSRIRSSWPTQEQAWLNQIKTTISDSLHKPMYFYEGGQHLTPIPFGEEPSYAQALLDIQRSPLMYSLYNDWYKYLRTLHIGSQPLKLMNFSFIGGRNARYGSWGLLESMTQDTAVIKSPKYQSTIENMAGPDCITVSIIENESVDDVKVYPNPFCSYIVINTESNEKYKSEICDINGRIVTAFDVNTSEHKVDLSSLRQGLYVLRILASDGKKKTYKLIKQ